MVKHHKKKEKNADFVKVRLKVGRKLPKCLNETKISLATGKIVIRGQESSTATTSVVSDVVDSLITQPPQWSVGQALLKKLRASQMDERLTAANKLVRWLSDLASSQQQQQQHRTVPFAVQELTEYLAPCLRDPTSPQLRSSARKIFSGLLTCGAANQPVCRPALFQALRTCWSHPDEAIQSEAVPMLESLLDLAPIVLLERTNELRAMLNRSLKRRLIAAASSNSSAAASSATIALRSRDQLMSLAGCVARFADLLADKYGGPSGAHSLIDHEQQTASQQISDNFDLNEASWSSYQLSWRIDFAALAGGDAADFVVSSSSTVDNNAVDNIDNLDVDKNMELEDELVEADSFERNFANLIKELFPGEFSGRVGGVSGHAEFLTLLRCLRSLLALHFARCSAAFSDCSDRLWWHCDCFSAGLGADPSKKQQQQQQRLLQRHHHRSSSTCQIAVHDLLSTILCPLFPLSVTPNSPSAAAAAAAGASQSAKKKQKQQRYRPGGGKDTLRDASSKALELNNLIVECALLAGPRLQSAASASSTGLMDSFAINVYQFLADRYAKKLTFKISPMEANYWLSASCRLIFSQQQQQQQQPSLATNPLARLFLAFFADSLRKNRFHQPEPVANFLVNLARHLHTTTTAAFSPSSMASIYNDSLDFLPQYLIDQFDSAQLHLLPSAAAAQTAEQSTACTAVRCLLLLLACEFPGARSAATAACDRLIRYCPDRLLRRSLSAALAAS